MMVPYRWLPTWSVSEILVVMGATAHSAEFNPKFWWIGLPQTPRRLPTLCTMPAPAAPSRRSAGQIELQAMKAAGHSAQF